MPQKEIELWWRQATSDIESARYNLEGKHLDVASFLAQQAAEKALKALRMRELREIIKTHDLVKLAKDVKAPINIVDNCANLNPVYIDTRYPDYADTIPAELYSEKAVENFIAAAEEVLAWTKKKLQL